MYNTNDIMNRGNNNNQEHLVRLAGFAGGSNALAMLMAGHQPEFYSTRKRKEVLSNYSQFPEDVQAGLKNGTMYSKDYIIQSPRELGKSSLSWSMLKRDDDEIDYLRNIGKGKFEHENVFLLTHISLKYYQGLEITDFSRTKFPEKLLGYGELIFKIEEKEAIRLPLSSCYEPIEGRDFDENNIIFELQKPIVITKGLRISLDLHFASALSDAPTEANAKHWILGQLHGSAAKQVVA